MSKDINREMRKIPSLNFLYEINGNGTILRNVKSKKQIKIKLDFHHSEKGYYAAWVCIKGKVKRLMIHSLVAECWLGRRPDGLQIDHIDRNSHNNDYRNLRYATHSEQMKNRRLSPETIERCRRNCEANRIARCKPVKLSTPSECFLFASMMRAAAFIAERVGLDAEHCRTKLKNRRSHIYGYDVEYL